VNVAVTVKQVPAVDALLLGPTRRLRRDGIALEMSAYCRRAVAKGVELAHATGGRCTVLSLGPPSASNVLREALACGADDAVLLSDPVFAGSDTLVTARALAALVVREGPFDLVLVGRASLDAETGQVGPQLAELLGLPFACAVRELEVLAGERSVRLRCEQDDGGCEMAVELPAVLAVAERLCRPAKADAALWSAISPARVRRVAAGELGDAGPWGAQASPTVVTALTQSTAERSGLVVPGTVAEQVRHALGVLEARGALAAEPDERVERVERSERATDAVPGLLRAARAAADGPTRAPDASSCSTGSNGNGGGGNGGGGNGGGGNGGDMGARSAVLVAVLVEPGRTGAAQELLGAASRLVHATTGHATTGHVVAVVAEPPALDLLAASGADEVLYLSGASATCAALAEEDVAAGFSRWAAEHCPAVVLAPATCWGREVASRSAVRLAAGLVGDALGLELVDGRLCCTKPACGSSQLATVTVRSAVQMATVRPGVLAAPAPRTAPDEVPVTMLPLVPAGRVAVSSRWCDDDLEALVRAPVVVGVGAAVSPDDYGEVRLLAAALGGELGATRKVTDNGWLPRSRQIGITGRSIAPRLYVAIGTSGKLNHLVGVRGAGTVLAVNADPDAPVFAGCDVGIVGDWHEVVRALLEQLGEASRS
jgi:electron transfer flavoprotein alpha subunit